MQKKQKILIGVAAVVVAAIAAYIVFSRPAQQNDTIRIGATLPLTGEIASYGQKAKRGLEMAQEEINEKGGVLGKRIEIVFADDKNDKNEALSNMNRFSTVDHFPVVFGSASSSVSLAIVPVANERHIILISPIASSMKLSTEGGKYFFRTCPADDQQAEVLAKWVSGRGAKNVAIVYTNNSWGKPLADGFKDKFEASGGKVLLNEGVAENTDDFRTIIQKLKGLANLDAVVSPSYPKEGGTFVRQTREMGLSVTLFGGDPWSSPEFRNIAGNAADGVFYTVPLESKASEYADFAKKYEAKYGEQPDMNSAWAYDAAMAIFKAISNAGSTDPDKIREALLRLSFSGVSGEVAFRANGDLATEAFAKKAIKNGSVIDSNE